MEEDDSKIEAIWRAQGMAGGGLYIELKCPYAQA